MNHIVEIVRNASMPNEQRYTDVPIGGSLDEQILFNADIDIKRHDEIHSPVLDEPLVVIAKHPRFAGGELNYYEADVVPRSELDDHDEFDAPAMVQQIVYGDVGKLAGRDLTELRIDAVTLLKVLARSIEDAEEIPEPRKKGLLQRLDEFRKDPYIVGIGSGVIMKCLESVFK